MFISALTTIALAATAFTLPTPPARRAPSPQDQQAYLDAHNSFRAQHGAAPLVWNQTLSDAGASWAGRCKFEHSGGVLGPFGENLAAGTNETPEGAVKSWTDEASEYQPMLSPTLKKLIIVLQRTMTPRTRNFRTSPKLCGRERNSSGAHRSIARPGPSSMQSSERLPTISASISLPETSSVNSGMSLPVIFLPHPLIDPQ
jgi:hypothetical protein